MMLCNYQKHPIQMRHFLVYLLSEFCLFLYFFSSILHSSPASIASSIGCFSPLSIVCSICGVLLSVSSFHFRPHSRSGEAGTLISPEMLIQGDCICWCMCLSFQLGFELSPWSPMCVQCSVCAWCTIGSRMKFHCRTVGLLFWVIETIWDLKSAIYFIEYFLQNNISYKFCKHAQVTETSLGHIKGFVFLIFAMNSKMVSRLFLWLLTIIFQCNMLGRFLNTFKAFSYWRLQQFSSRSYWY